MTPVDLETIINTASHATPEGTVTDATLRLIGECLRDSPPQRSMETGCGRTTVLLSQFSQHHTVFCVEDSGNRAVADATADSGRVHWVFGPSQKTLPIHQFEAPLDFALIDGPHAYPFPDLEYYFIYPHLREGAWLLLDDVHIPTIHNLFSFLKDDAMFRFVKRSGDTAFFRRTSAAVFSPHGDNWWTQQYNIDNLFRLKPWSVRMKIRLRRLLGLERSVVNPGPSQG